MLETRELEDIDLLSAIWILASNDENPLITYLGLTHRLGLHADYDVRATVGKRRELFRPGATVGRILAWKDEMRTGRNIPGWIAALDSPSDRTAAIEAITPNDVFRSQFRTQAKAERSPVSVITWGLEHLERIRKGKVEAQDANAKKWQMWLVFGVSAAGVISQFGIAYARYRRWI
jgi:hypothetical protein